MKTIDLLGYIHIEYFNDSASLCNGTFSKYDFEFKDKSQELLQCSKCGEHVKRFVPESHTFILNKVKNFMSIQSEDVDRVVDKVTTTLDIKQIKIVIEQLQDFIIYQDRLKSLQDEESNLRFRSDQLLMEREALIKEFKAKKS